nr:HAUS augmin-like complex subunit 3 [Peromyscus maniculatus bairdii]
MSCGKEFVETLKKIGYPKADSLNGEDFDWLFEAVEDESFLKWFCGNVNEQNVLSEKELEAFSILQRSGKPILEGTALDEALRTCKTFDLKTPTLDDTEIQKLEDEVQTLQKLKNLKIQRRNKYQLMASETSYKSLALNAKQEEATKKLKQSQGFLNAVNTKLSNELQVLADGVNNLMMFFRNSNLGQGTNPMVFLSQFSLKKYISQEEQSTAALTLYTKKQFFQGIHEVVESSNEENFQLLDIQTPSICDNEEILGERRLEMARLQIAYICAQQQIIYLKASNLSMKSSIKWAEENLHSLTSEAIGKENLDAKISSLNSEILKLEEQITHIKDKLYFRLYQLLKGDNKKKELFITHEHLEEVAEKLKQDISLIQDQLAVSTQEHFFFLSKLNNDVDMLCDALYHGGNQLLLCDQELMEHFHRVESKLNKLNHLLTDILADVKTKRKILAINKLHQVERELYVYFFKDEDYLKDVVENLENQSKIKASGLKD